MKLSCNNQPNNFLNFNAVNSLLNQKKQPFLPQMTAFLNQ